MIQQELKNHLIKLNIPSLQLFNLKSKAAVQHGEKSARLREHLGSDSSYLQLRGASRKALTRLYLNVVSCTIEPCPPDSESAALGWGQESPQAIRMSSLGAFGLHGLPPKLLPSPAPQIPRFPNKQHSQSQAFPNSYTHPVPDFLVHLSTCH